MTMTALVPKCICPHDWWFAWQQNYDFRGNPTSGHVVGEQNVWTRTGLNPRCRQHGRLRVSPAIWECA